VRINPERILEPTRKVKPTAQGSDPFTLIAFESRSRVSELSLKTNKQNIEKVIRNSKKRDL
jgi:hypothetical protein